MNGDLKREMTRLGVEVISSVIVSEFETASVYDLRLVETARLTIGVNSYWAQGLKPPPHFYDHGARLYDEPPTFVT